MEVEVGLEAMQKLVLQFAPRFLRWAILLLHLYVCCFAGFSLLGSLCGFIDLPHDS